MEAHKNSAPSLFEWRVKYGRGRLRIKERQGKFRASYHTDDNIILMPVVGATPLIAANKLWNTHPDETAR